MAAHHRIFDAIKAAQNGVTMDQIDGIMVQFRFHDMNMRNQFLMTFLCLLLFIHCLQFPLLISLLKNTCSTKLKQ